MIKPGVMTYLRLHGVENLIRIMDYISDGRYVPLGAQAAAMVSRHEAVHYMSQEGKEVIIPYHAIIAVAHQKYPEDWTPPEDAFCESTNKYLVEFLNSHLDAETGDCRGGDVLQSKLVADGSTPVYSGETPVSDALPSATFIGWYTEAYCNVNDIPEDLIPVDSPLPRVNGAPVTYYAVFHTN